MATLLKKSVTSEIKASNYSSAQARELKKAIIDISSTTSNSLCRQGKAVKLSEQGNNKIYAYRLGNGRRIIYNEINGKKFIQKIFDSRVLDSK